MEDDAPAAFAVGGRVGGGEVRQRGGDGEVAGVAALALEHDDRRAVGPAGLATGEDVGELRGGDGDVGHREVDGDDHGNAGVGDRVDAEGRLALVQRAGDQAEVDDVVVDGHDPAGRADALEHDDVHVGAPGHEGVGQRARQRDVGARAGQVQHAVRPRGRALVEQRVLRDLSLEEGRLARAGQQRGDEHGGEDGHAGHAEQHRGPQGGERREARGSSAVSAMATVYSSRKPTSINTLSPRPGPLMLEPW